MARILLVEDDQWMADCYAQWLHADGHTVAHARDAQEALDLVDGRAPDVIVLDLLLPYANGVQLLNTLQSHVDLANIPIVLCSGSLPDSLPAAGKYGIRVVLDKASLGPGTLRAAVKEAMVHAAI